MLTDNVNFLAPTGFKLVINKTPNLEYFCTAVTVPSIIVGETAFSTATRNVSLYPDKLNFDFFTIRMLLDEDMKNYREIFDWLNELVFTEDRDLRDKAEDVSLVIMSSHNNPVQTINFSAAYPISLGSLDFDSANTDVQYISSEVQFKFTSMTFV